MATVNVRELRNNGGGVIDRVVAGERVVVTRAGHPVAELRPMPSAGTSAEVLVERWRHLPPLDGRALLVDLDRVVDPSL
ncbi:MAG: type II toxin-antitoxin system prevent-host-death family antitoxin [Chloroflexi bacterium]|nr:type II toxin-antitoxin system prevent-host-death family antitoxin [Chloroflexota bacterium]